ncbi:MAG TPA: tRNA pseudouridine(55) synthase TruB, partial [Burkholderiales bacterium]|nr:tRNA pseudouridine(55) synthase TruB [Burkholderiales bacterium]
EREPRQVMIHALDLVARDGDSVSFRVTCSKGTYVRTLAEDIGETLGCGAHLTALRREATGGFDLGGAITLAQLQEMDITARMAALRPVDALVAALPSIQLDAALAARLRQGQRLPLQAAPGLARAYDPEQRFLGLVRVADGVAHPERLAA